MKPGGDLQMLVDALQKIASAPERMNAAEGMGYAVSVARSTLNALGERGAPELPEILEPGVTFDEAIGEICVRARVRLVPTMEHGSLWYGSLVGDNALGRYGRTPRLAALQLIADFAHHQWYKENKQP